MGMAWFRTVLRAGSHESLETALHFPVSLFKW